VLPPSIFKFQTQTQTRLQQCLLDGDGDANEALEPARALPMLVVDTKKYTLRPYQETAVDFLMHHDDDDDNDDNDDEVDSAHHPHRSLVVMPTGSGKTVVFVSLLERFLKPGGRALIIAHRDELIDQAIDKLRDIVPSFFIEKEKAAERASHVITDKNVNCSVVVASVQSLTGKRLKAWPNDAFDIIIVDEAHHAPADSYYAILKHFGCMDVKRKTRLVGFTATPYRSDNKLLVGSGGRDMDIFLDKSGLKMPIFHEEAFELKLKDAIAMGYLAPIHSQVVKSQVSLDEIKTHKGDFVLEKLQKVVNVVTRNELIVSAYEKYALGEQTIVFAAGVQHAKEIADLFVAKGHPAMAITGDNMDVEERKRVLAKFASGELRILTNFNLLVEGFDSPSTSCIILARPTQSSLVVTQCIGRGTRICAGKDRCLVLDVVDVLKGKKLWTAASLAGLPARFDAKGNDVMALKEKYESLPKDLQSKVIDADQLERVLALVKKGLSVEEIDLFDDGQDADASFLSNLRTNYALKCSKFAWIPIGVKAWMLELPIPDDDGDDDKKKTAYYTLQRQEPDGLYILESAKEIAAPLNITGTLSLRKVFDLVDGYLEQKVDQDRRRFVLHNQTWRKGGASSAQLKMIIENNRRTENFDFDGIDPTHLTSGEASQIICLLKYFSYKRITKQRLPFYSVTERLGSAPLLAGNAL